MIGHESGYLKIGAALAVLAAATPRAFAEEPGDVTTMTVTHPGEEDVTTVSVSREVAFRDLDLTTPDGRFALQERVKQAASDACRELDRRLPARTNAIAVPENRHCVQNTIADAMPRVRRLVEAANRG